MVANAGFTTVESAAALAGISARTLRYWIAAGKLPARGGKRGRLVRLSDVEQLAVLAGKFSGKGSLPADSAMAITGTIAESSALVAIERQLAEYRELVERLHRENLELAGRLGFYQAKLQDAEARILEFEGPNHSALVEMANHPAPSENGADSAAQKVSARPWWQFWRWYQP